MLNRGCVLAAMGVVGLFAALPEVSTGALAQRSGGSGYSGTLNSNAFIRQQQLICDPDDPTRGSTSVTYDTGVVSLANFSFGPGYDGDAAVEVTSGTQTFLQSITSFLAAPAGTETGYVQFRYFKVGQTGQMGTAQGFFFRDEDGVEGVDTHAIFFDYLSTVPDSTVATYQIFADVGGRASGNRADSLTAVDEQGEFTLGPAQLSSAEVSGNLIPLPPAVWAGASLLVGLMGAGVAKRRLAGV